MAKHISEDDLALFALALTPPEEAAFSATHVKDCQLCREELARLQGDLAVYAMTAEAQTPSPAARTRLLEAVAREQRSAAPQPAAEPLRSPRNTNLFDRGPRREEPIRRGPAFFPWLGWAVAAGLAATTVWQFRQADDLRDKVQSEAVALQQSQAAAPNTAEVARAQQVLQTLTDPAAMQVALHLPLTPGAQPRPEAHAAYIAEKGQLVFIASHLRPIQPNKTYELWVLPSATGQKPVPAGIFRPDLNGNASVVLPALPRNIAAKGFGVTIENAGGSLSPTPPIVLAGTQS